MKTQLYIIIIPTGGYGIALGMTHHGHQSEHDTST